MRVPKYEDYSLDNDGLLRFRGRLYVPPNEDIRQLILNEAHRAVYMAHPGVKKMSADLKPLFFWKGMKKDIVNLVTKCLECQRVKAEHRHPAGLLQPYEIPILDVQHVHSTTYTYHPLHNMYTTSHVQDTTCTTCTQHHMYIIPLVHHVCNAKHT